VLSFPFSPSPLYPRFEQLAKRFSRLPFSALLNDPLVKFPIFPFPEYLRLPSPVFFPSKLSVALYQKDPCVLRLREGSPASAGSHTSPSCFGRSSFHAGFAYLKSLRTERTYAPTPSGFYRALATEQRSQRAPLPGESVFFLSTSGTHFSLPFLVTRIHANIDPLPVKHDRSEGAISLPYSFYFLRNQCSFPTLFSSLSS